MLVIALRAYSLHKCILSDEYPVPRALKSACHVFWTGAKLSCEGETRTLSRVVPSFQEKQGAPTS